MRIQDVVKFAVDMLVGCRNVVLGRVAWVGRQVGYYPPPESKPQAEWSPLVFEDIEHTLFPQGLDVETCPGDKLADLKRHFADDRNSVKR